MVKLGVVKTQNYRYQFMVHNKGREREKTMSILQADTLASLGHCLPADYGKKNKRQNRELKY